MKKLDTKAITHLFKLRNDQEKWQKYDPNSSSMILFNDIPAVPMYQRAKFLTDLTANRNLKSALDNIGYNYVFNKNVLTRLIEEDAKESEIPIIIACFQLVSLCYDNNKEVQISTDDFSLFMQILNFNFIESIKDEINFLFRSLLEISLEIKNFEWTKTNIDLVIKQFNQNKSLPNSFYLLFCDFLSIILEFPNRDDYYPPVLDFLYLVFQEKRVLIETDKLFELIKFIKPLIIDLDPKALYILSEISKRIDYEVPPKTSSEPRQTLIELIDQLVPLFDSKTVSISTEKFQLTTNKEDSQIHNLPCTFSSEEIDDYKFDFQFDDKKLFQTETVMNLPKELITEENFSLFKRFDSDIVDSIDTFVVFLENLAYKWSYHYLHKLIQYIIEANQKDEVKYQLIASFILLLKKLTDSTKIDVDLSQYLTLLFDDNSDKPLFFDARKTAFGPYALDPLLNDFRSAIIELLLLKSGGKIVLINKICLFKLLKIQSKQPFLITETLVRLLYKVSIEELLDSRDIIKNDASTLLVSNNDKNNMTIIENEKIIKEPFSFVNDLLLTVSKTALVLKKLDAPIESRNAISSFIIALLSNKSSFYSCLTMNYFVDCLFNFIFENGLSKIFLTTIYKSLLLLDKSHKIAPLEYLVNLMFQASEFISAKENELKDYMVIIKEMIFDIISFTIRLVPRLSKLYEQFIIPILYDVSSVETMNRAFYVLITFSMKKNFVLDMRIFDLLVEKIQYMKYINIINLIGLSTTLSRKSMFMIRRPCYIPLLFIMFNKNDENKDVRLREDVIELLKELATYSEYNRRCLHDGKVDSILLSYINNENPIRVKGVEIHLDYQDVFLKKDALYLLNLIIPAKSSNEIVSHIIDIMTSQPNVVSGISNYYDIYTELYKIVSKSINHPKPFFDIGNIRAFCFASGIDPIYFKDTTFTISFMMKADPLLLNKSTSQVMVVSLFDHSQRRLSIVLMSNGIYASYEANNQNTVVPLVQRSNPNEWAFYTFMFIYKKGKTGTGTGTYLITSYKNLERQHDSEFCNIKFDATPDLTLLLGGCSYSNRKVRNNFERCASISNLSILPGAPKTRDDIVNILLQNQKAALNYIFSTNNFNPKLTNRTEKMTFNNKEIEVQFVRNIYENTTVETFLSNYSIKLINSFKNLEQNMFKYITPFLSLSLQNIDSPKLINKFESILMGDQISKEKLNFVFFKSLFDITFVLYNCEKSNNRKMASKKKSKQSNVSDSYVITDCWSKSIVFNIDIWKKSEEFTQILEFLSLSISNHYIQKLFSKRDDFFSYFLYQLNSIIEEGNDEIIDNFILFLSRVSYIQLSREDCSKLFSLYCNVKSKDIMIHYLKLIQNISQSISKSGFKGLNDFSSIYSLIESCSASENEDVDSSDLIDIVVNLILVLHELYGKEFHTKVIKIVRAFSMASSSFIKKLFSNLESSIDEYPNLFSLTTLIAFNYRIIITSGVSKIPSKNKFNQSELWFVFPTLLALANFSPKMLKQQPKEEKEEEVENDNIKLSKKLFEFIVENSIEANSFDSVTNFINLCSKRNITLNNEIKPIEEGYLIDNPLYYYLNLLIDKIFALEIENKDVIFNVYMNTITSLFFHLNIKTLQFEKPNMDPIQHLELIYTNKNNLNESFTYHVCMTENQEMCNIDLINHAIQLAYKHINLFGHHEKISEKNKKPSLLNIGIQMINGENIKNTKNSSFSIQEINEFILLFKSKSDKSQITPNLYIDKFKNMNSVFDWLWDTLKTKFKDDFKATSDLITSRLFYNISQNYPLYGKAEWINYVKNYEKNLSTKQIGTNENNESFELLPILNFCYCPFLRRNKKIIDEKDEDEELCDFFEDVNHYNNERIDFEPNAFNIVYGRKVPICFRIDQEGVFVNDRFISYSVFKFVISMNRSHKNSDEDSANDLINNSILFILTNGISFLLQFVENSSYFIQTIKKQKLPPQCFIAHSKDEMIEFLKPICISWQSSLISTFDFLNVLNLMDGRTYLVSNLDDNNKQHYPIFPSIEFLKQSTSSKQQFASPEIYYLIDEYPEAYENRKMLEKSSIIHEFVQIAFPDFFASTNNNNNNTQTNSSQSGANIRINPRKPSAIHPVSIQKVDILPVMNSIYDSSLKFRKKILFVSELNMPNYPPIFAFVFSNGLLVFCQVTFDKSGKLCFDPIVTKDFPLRKMTTEGKKVISSITSKHGIMMKCVKMLNYSEYDLGIIFFDQLSIRTISIKRLSSSPISIPSTSSNNNTNDSSKSSSTMSGPSSTPIPRRSSSSSSGSSMSLKSPYNNIQLKIPLPDNSNNSIQASNLNANSISNTASNKSYAKLSLTEDNFCPFEQNLFAQSIFLRNPSTVSTAFFGEIESSIVDIVLPAASVICLHQSRRFSVVAVGCDDGRVIVHALCPGIRVSVIQTTVGETVNGLIPLPTKILITDNCGLILIYTSTSKLIVSTLSGTVVKSVSKFNTILSWFCFVPVSKQIDYIGFVGCKNNGNDQKFYGYNNYLCYFEASKPDEVHCLAELPKNCNDFKIHFDKLRNAFIVASCKGEVIVIPMPEIENGDE